MKFGKRKQKVEQNQRRRPDTNRPGVFSYYSQRSGAPLANAESVGRRAESISPIKRLNLRLGYLPSYIALIAVLIGVFYSFWLQPLPRITVISQAGTVHRDSKLYQQEIEDIWRKTLLNQTKLTVHSGTIRNDILDHFGELADAQIELPLLGRRPAITLTPAKPAMQLISANGTFYVSSTGRVMAKTTDVTQNQLGQLPLIRDEGGLNAEVGKFVIPEPQAVFLQKLYAQLVAAQVSVQSITLPNNAANEADVRIGDKAYYIKFSTDTDPRQAVGTYIAARDKLNADGVTPAEYIDVRVEEKVFYR
jgi:hypothetical protein